MQMYIHTQAVKDFHYKTVVMKTLKIKWINNEILYRIPLHESQLCPGEGAWITQWSDEPCYVGPPKTGHSREFWENMIHWRREWQITPVHLPWESHKLYKRPKRYDTKRWVPQVWRYSGGYWEGAEENHQ